MISERTFASRYASFWRNLLPFGDRYVRVANLAQMTFARKREPVSERRSLIGELTSRIFLSWLREGRFLPGATADMGSIVEATVTSLLRFRDVEGLTRPTSEEEVKEASSLAWALSNYFDVRMREEPWIAAPRIRGAGFLASCEADLITGSRLCEIKTVARPFRNTDFRQVIVYLALNHGSGQYQISSVALLNPLTGRGFQAAVNELIRGMANRAPVDVFDEVLDFVSESAGSGQ